MNVRMLSFIAMVSAGLLLFSATSRADEPFEKCLHEAGPSLLAMGYCGQDLVQREEDRQLHIWKLLKDTTRTEVIAEEEQSQVRWRQYEQSACQFYQLHVVPQKEEAVGYSACHAKLIAERTEHLEQILQETNTWQ